MLDPRDENGEEEPLTDHQEESISEFTRSVYDSLLRDIDRRGQEHEISFEAQDDAWAMCWRERTGIPLVSFKKRWEQLKDWTADATLHPRDPQNRDPHATEEQRAEYVRLKDLHEGKKASSGLGALGASQASGSVLKKRKTSGLYGGSAKSLISIVSTSASEYLESYKGHDDSADNGALHNLLRRIQSGQEEDIAEVEHAHKALEYRMSQMSIADRYLQLMEVPAPKGQQCHEYEINYKDYMDIGKEKYSQISELIWERIVLFPMPVEDQGRPFHKPREYLVSAFHHAGTSKDDVIKKLDFLAASIDREVEQQKEIVKHDPEVTSKRRKLFHAFGIALGNMSPSKRQSLS